MLGSGSRDARRTERYIDGLMDAEERGVDSAPMDMDLDPAVMFAAGELRAGLVRVHPSFRFEEGLAARLSATAERLSHSPELTSVAAPADDLADRSPVNRSRHGRPPRPLVVGGVGVASAALSLGAVYVAWRWSRASRPMVRAARAARSGRGHTSGSGRRAGALHGILG